MLLKGFCWNISCLNCGIWDTATFRKHSYLRVIGARRRYLKSTLDLQKLNLTRMSIRMEKWKSSLSLECLASRHSGQNFSADPASAQLQPCPSLRRDCSILNFPVFSHLPLWLWVQNERGKRAEISRCQWNSSANTIQSAPPPCVDELGHWLKPLPAPTCRWERLPPEARVDICLRGHVPRSPRLSPMKEHGEHRRDVGGCRVEHKNGGWGALAFKKGAKLCRVTFWLCARPTSFNHSCQWFSWWRFLRLTWFWWRPFQDS